jgi:hypothetical protein
MNNCQLPNFQCVEKRSYSIFVIDHYIILTDENRSLYLIYHHKYFKCLMIVFPKCLFCELPTVIDDIVNNCRNECRHIIS